MITAALAGIILVSAAPASAHGIAKVSVENAAYLPGDTVTVNGIFQADDFAPVDAPATVTLGPEGPVLGTSPVASDGSWTLTFTLPTATELGTYALYAAVLQDDGSVLKNLLTSTALVVGAPAAPTAQPTPTPTSVVPIPAAGSSARSGTAPPVAPSVRPPATRARAALVVGHARIDVPAAAPRASNPTPHALRRAAGPARPEQTLRTRRAPRAGPPPSTATPHRLPRVTAARRASPWLLVALLIFAAAVAGGGLALARRRPWPISPDPVEAELQLLLAGELEPGIDPVEEELQALLREERERAFR